jgi:hypothetical protein
MRQTSEDLVLSRNRLILKLFEQNFALVDGPCFDDPDGVHYDVSRRDVANERMPRVCIEFQRQFLSERDSDFVRFTLDALLKAKRILHVRSGSTGSPVAVRVSDAGVRIGWDTTPSGPSRMS